MYFVVEKNSQTKWPVLYKDSARRSTAVEEGFDLRLPFSSSYCLGLFSYFVLISDPGRVQSLTMKQSEKIIFIFYVILFKSHLIV